MNHCTESRSETPEEKNARIDVMLRTMVVEAGLHAFENGDPPPLLPAIKLVTFADAVKITLDDLRSKP